MKSRNHSDDLVVSFGIAWERFSSEKQTIFPVWSDSNKEPQPHLGLPPQEKKYTLRATKNINMHPFPKLHIAFSDGSNYSFEEELRLSIVSSINKGLPPFGRC